MILPCRSRLPSIDNGSAIRKTSGCWSNAQLAMNIKEQMMDAIDQICTTCKRLRPPCWRINGLVPAFRMLIAGVLLWHDNLISLDAQANGMVACPCHHRLAQEMPANAVERSQATRVNMHLRLWDMLVLE